MSNKISITVKPYVLQICTDKVAWDNLVEASPQGNVFSKTAFLESLGVPYSRFLVTTPQGEALAGVAILEEGAQMAKAPFAFTPHQGILFASNVAELASQKRITIEFRITTFLIETLLDKYPNFSMSLSPYFRDLRPFLWHNYGKIDMPKFNVIHRYTGHLSLQNLDLQQYLKSIRTLRRREYKNTEAKIQQSSDLNQFLKLYELTFQRQDLSLNSHTMELVKRISLNAIEEGYGLLSSAIVDGREASMALFLTHQKTVYYLFGANDPELRDKRASSKLFIDNIVLFANSGFKCFDFVGVNSPQRGDFKLSFNASLVPYQEVHLQSYV